MSDWAKPLLEGVAELGPWGPAAFVGLYVLATVCMVPGSLLTLGAGAVFGLARGSVIVSVAATLGAAAAFLVGRYLARGRVARRLETDPRLRRIDGAIRAGGWWIVLLLRLSPVFPFNVLNYALSVTDVRLTHYVAASWLGMLPGTVLYVYIGSAAGGLAGLGGGRARTPAEWALFAVGLVATAAVTVYLTRAARRSIDKTLEGTQA
ncbi:MAG: TVP38/TMEM64 family protein [Elusimicrobia bacterium]|nr:TVP38/TMEM64 family protein [Elusimicrobiota bacterium]